MFCLKEIFLTLMFIFEAWSSDKKRILLLPHPYKSHVLYFSALGEALVDQGYEVFMTSNGDIDPNLGGLGKSGIKLLKYGKDKSHDVDDWEMKEEMNMILQVKIIKNTEKLPNLRKYV